MNAVSIALHRVIGPDNPHLDAVQLSARAVIVFLVGIAYIRAVGARTFARGTPLDIVISVIIGSNLSRTLTGSAAFLPTLAGTAVLVALHWLFAKATHRFPWLSRLVKGEPHDLVRDGVVNERELDRRTVTHHDLDEALREKGLDDAAKAKRVVLERGGQITVIKASSD